jgi:prepilin-type N-terminal cleavage/methylation domain-containing protein
MKKGFTIIEALIGLVLIPIIGLGIYGWINNILKLVHIADASNHIGMLALRIVGIFMAPLGAILGYC